MTKQSEPLQIKDRRKCPFCVIDVSIMEDQSLSAYDKIIYVALCTFVPPGEFECSPSVKDIASKASCCERQVRRSVQSLIKKDLIERIERESGDGGTATNSYVLRGSGHER